MVNSLEQLSLEPTLSVQLDYSDDFFSQQNKTALGSKKFKGKGGKAPTAKSKKTQAKSAKKKRHEKYGATKKNKYFTKVPMNTIPETESEGED